MINFFANQNLVLYITRLFLDGGESLDESSDEIVDDSEKSDGEESDISPEIDSAHLENINVERILTKLEDFDQGQRLVPSDSDHLQDARFGRAFEDSGKICNDSEGSVNNFKIVGVQSEVVYNGSNASGNELKEFGKSTEVFGIRVSMPAEASGTEDEFDDYENETEDTEIRSESERSSNESFSEINTIDNGDDDLLRQLGKKLYILNTNYT